MADHSVVAWNGLYESEASWASVFCFDNTSSEKSCSLFYFASPTSFYVPECYQKG